VPTRLRHPWTLRAATLLSVGAAMLGTGLTQSSHADLQGQISSAKSAASDLQSQIDSDTASIEKTDGGIDAARTRLDDLQSTLNTRVGELRSTQTKLVDARNHLIEVENRLHAATSALSANLVADYEGQKPDLMTVVLQAQGFTQLLQQVGFVQRAGRQDANIVQITRTARREVSSEANQLETLEARDRRLADQVLAERNQVAALQAALERQHVDEVTARSRADGRFAAERDHIADLQKKLNAQEAAAAARAKKAAETGDAQVGGLAIDTGGMVQPPAGAPPQVAQIIAAGNAIATLPYIWGGGHGSFEADGYDCSGSVSYVLAAAGLLSAPEVSGDFMSYGDPGPGQWVTIYATDGHVWMTVAGWRFDTVALAEDGTRWSQGGGEFGGYVERHPPGL
jgi:peptidoglycan hydrolase CwlO-like protein